MRESINKWLAKVSSHAIWHFRTFHTWNIKTRQLRTVIAFISSNHEQKMLLKTQFSS